MKKNKFIISGGGTGGHIFPALSIANELKRQYPDADILFVGAEGKMEMERVPAAGYPIIGLPIRGFNRQQLWKNISVLIQLIRSLFLARNTLREFKPDAVIGVGGYASGPVLWMAQRMGIPTIIQEQNSYAGVANKLLAKRAASICVAYPNMERFFPKERIVLTGNPVRSELFTSLPDKDESLRHFGLSPDKKVILLVGGSLGARTLNDSVKQHIATIEQAGVQLLWQCGGYYRKEMEQFVSDNPSPAIILTPFIHRMDYAFSAADLIISRAGAGSVSEFCLIGKPVILVPSPNVAEDHQTHNALSLVNRQAAHMVADRDAREKLFPAAIKLLNNDEECTLLSQHILQLGLPHAAANIVNEIKRALSPKQ